MRRPLLATAALLALAATPAMAASSSNPTSSAFQSIAARASAEATASFTTWLRKQTKNGLQSCDPRTPRRLLYGVAAHSKSAANDEWLLAVLVRAQGGNASRYLTKAALMSRAAARATVILRRCG